jgi:hypothetical protein
MPYLSSQPGEEADQLAGQKCAGVQCISPNNLRPGGRQQTRRVRRGTGDSIESSAAVQDRIP